MKKIVTLALLFAGAFTSAAYAQGNLFTPADCDANGWLWFDTQAKIDKYVGEANSDKIIKMVPTKYQVEVEPDIFENLKNTASPTVYGAGTDGYLPGTDESGAAVGTDAKQGAIVLAPASGAGQQNGGGILMYLPSCYYCEVFLSAETRLTPCLYAGLGYKETIDLGIVKGFALTLALGVIVSMFSAITITKNFMHLIFGAGKLTHPALFGLRKSDIEEGYQAVETKREKAKFGILD